MEIPLKKLGIKSQFDPGIPLLGIYPEETKIERDSCVHWDDPEGWDGEGGERGLQDGEHM